MLVWEAIAFAALGLLAASAAARLFPLRFPFTALLLATGPAAGLLGGLVTYTVLGGGHAPYTLLAAFLTAVALTSVLARPPRKGRHARMRSAA
ncbi:hypothetical protein [Actinacidiphila acididurans]|uniref:Integral membrane protein n=1 Tax=Actinacidiphila acididurans TaxID=2784346 RepID=A0ABS2TX75_9ACTN|nr:hypothetical protein [Actinacidiphila acididurans]MBM9507687.1 hypothetical protein [Actinacidiphila acididurans]